MKQHRVSIEIDLPIEKVVELYTRRDATVHWQNHLQKIESVSGEPWQPGSIANYVFEYPHGPMVLQETIHTNDLPQKISAVYAWDKGANSLVNTFSAIDENRTRWEQVAEYKNIKGFMFKFMSMFLPFVIKSKHMMFLNNFKRYAEDGVSIRDASKK